MTLGGRTRGRAEGEVKKGQQKSLKNEEGEKGNTDQEGTEKGERETRHMHRGRENQIEKHGN